MPDNGVMSKGITIIGGGGHAKVVLDAMRGVGMFIRGFVDDQSPCPLSGMLDHLGSIDTVEEDDRVILAIGDVVARRRVLGRLGAGRVAGPVIHTGAIVSPSASVGEGAFVGPGAIVNAEARVGAHAIVNTGAIVEHDCRVGMNTHIAPGSVLGGGVEVGEDALVGLGARVLPGIVIGDGCVVGAGAVVTRDVPSESTVVGVPGRVMAIGNPPEVDLR